MNTEPNFGTTGEVAGIVRGNHGKSVVRTLRVALIAGKVKRWEALKKRVNSVEMLEKKKSPGFGGVGEQNRARTGGQPCCSKRR